MEKIGENIYFLRGSRSSNIYLFDFGVKALIDTGHPDEIRQNIEEFGKHGIAVEQIGMIINTHSHGDHVGGNAYLKRKNPGIRIAGADKKSYQQSRKTFSFLKNVEDQFEDYPIDVILTDKDKIDLGGCVLEVIETKGHTRDSLSFYIRERKILFSGDTFYHRIIAQVDYYQDMEKSLSELMDAYLKIERLDPDIIYTGHGDPIRDPSANTAYCIGKLKRFMRRPELVVINNFIPSLEFFIYKNNGCEKSVLKKEIIGNMNSFKNSPFLKYFREDEFDGIFEKMFSLMKILNYFTDSGGKIFLNRKLNAYLDIGDDRTGLPGSN